MKNFFRKCVIVIVAFLSLGSSLIAMAAFADLTTEIWIAFLVVAISAAIWYWFFHLFYEYRSKSGNE